VGYEDARSRIATVLATVAITSPLVLAIKRVYEDPPATVEDHPCFIVYGSSGQAEWMVGGDATEEDHTERCRLVVHDADLERAARLVRAFRAATIMAFQAESGLASHATVFAFRWEEPKGFTYGGRDYTGMDFLIGFHVNSPATVGAVAYDPACTLLADITAGALNFTYVSTGDPIALWDVIQIDSEKMIVISVTPASNLLLVGRGYGGTTAAAHTAGAAILRWGTV